LVKNFVQLESALDSMVNLISARFGGKARKYIANKDKYEIEF